jgi:hypothetical protein
MSETQTKAPARSTRRGRPAASTDHEAQAEAKTLAGLVPEPGSEEAKADAKAAPRPRGASHASKAAAKATGKPAAKAPAPAKGGAKPEPKAEPKPKAEANGAGSKLARKQAVAKAVADLICREAGEEVQRVTGEALTAEEKARVSYWVRYLSTPVEDGVRYWPAEGGFPRPTTAGWEK